MEEFLELLNKYRAIGMDTAGAFQSINNLQMVILQEWIVEKGFATYQEIHKVLHDRLPQKTDETIEMLKKK